VHSHQSSSTPEFQARDQPSENASDVDIDIDSEDGPFNQEAWDDWYREQIRLSIADPRPNIPHDVVMREANEVIWGKEARHGRARNA